MLFNAIGLISIAAIFLWRPVKLGVKVRPTDEMHGVFLCKRESYDVKWSIVLEKRMDILKRLTRNRIEWKNVDAELINLEGHDPGKELEWFFFIAYNNVFVIRGRRTGKRVNVGTEGDPEYIDTLYADDWDIVAPMNRDDLLGYCLPPWWLTPADFRKK